MDLGLCLWEIMYDHPYKVLRISGGARLSGRPRPTEVRHEVGREATASGQCGHRRVVGQERRDAGGSHGGGVCGRTEHHLLGGGGRLATLHAEWREAALGNIKATKLKNELHHAIPRQIPFIFFVVFPLHKFFYLMEIV